MYISVIYVRRNKSVNLRDFFNRQKLADMERKATLIMVNPRAKMVCVITMVALLSICSPHSVLAAADPFTIIGNKFWGYVKSFGRAACLIMAGVEVIKSLGGSDFKNIAKIIFKYLIAYATFTILPWLFDVFDRDFHL